MRRDRIHGPYKHRNRYRVIEVGSSGEKQMVSFETEAEALKYIEAARKVAVGHTVGEAVRDYLTHLRETPARRGGTRRDSTVDLNRGRLENFLQLPDADRPLGAFTVGYARELFKARAAEVKPDTLITELAVMRRWWAFCREEYAAGRDPFDGLQVVGELSTGKPQLREDEARRFLGSALAEGSQGGLAAALALLTGMRATEVTGLVVRDLDSGGRVLWVADNAVRKLKTRKMRRLQVPELLVPRLAALVVGADGKPKGPDDRLFTDEACKEGVHRYWLYNHVERLCGKAGVPRVSPHGLRGTFATLAREVMSTEKVAATIGNLPKVSATNYIEAGAAMSADARTLAQTLGGTDEVHGDSGVRGRGPGSGVGCAGGGTTDDRGLHHDGEASGGESDGGEQRPPVRDLRGEQPVERVTDWVN